ncbi:MAG: TrmH family RNA methyltransferase [Dokdonella sp.]
MTDENPWAKARPAARSPDKRERQRSRDEAAPSSPAASPDPWRKASNSPQRSTVAEGAERRSPARGQPQRRDDEDHEFVGDVAPRPTHREARWYGVNACLAAFAKRPDDLRKVYLTEARLGALKPVLAWCVQHKLGYRVVETADLDRLTGSRHHEGVCFDMLRHPPLDLAGLLASAPPTPTASLLLWLDGVGNPYNLGALLRTAAHFEAAGVIVPAASSLDLSGAAARVAEGGAEAVPLARIDDDNGALAQLRDAGYAIAATLPREGSSLYATTLPKRLVLILGAEGEGMSDVLVAAADLRVGIPGSGVVESLNIAASAAVVMGEYWRQHRGDC